MCNAHILDQSHLQHEYWMIFGGAWGWGGFALAVSSAVNPLPIPDPSLQDHDGRCGFKAMLWSNHAATQQAKHDRNQRNYQQNMDQAANGVGGGHAEQPQNQ
jgi:hypothetical protein